MPLTESTFGDTAVDRIVDHFLRNIPYSPPASLWIALSGDLVSRNPVGFEPVGNGYARIEIRGATGRSFSAPVTTDNRGKIYNNEVWIFPEATGNWGTMNSVHVMDAVTGGNSLGSADSGAVEILAGEQYLIEFGEFYFQNTVPDVSLTMPGGFRGGCLTGIGHAKFCNLIFRGDATAPPDTNVWLGLLDNDGGTQAGREAPYTDGGQSEPTNGGYARIEIGEDSPGTGIGIVDRLGGSQFNGFEIAAGILNFPTITETYTNNVWFIGFFQQQTGGAMLGFGSISNGGNSNPPLGTLTGGITCLRGDFVQVDDEGNNGTTRYIVRLT